MKKENIKTAIIVILVLVIVIGGSFFLSFIGTDSTVFKTTGESNLTEESIPRDEQSELTMIDIDQYLSLKSGGNLSIVYIARPTCGYCQEQEPIVKNLVYLYNIKVNYLNTDELDEAGFDKLIQSDEYFAEGFGTPLIILVKDNQIVDIAEGYHSKSELVEFLQNNGLI